MRYLFLCLLSLFQFAYSDYYIKTSDHKTFVLTNPLYEQSSFFQKMIRHNPKSLGTKKNPFTLKNISSKVLHNCIAYTLWQLRNSNDRKIRNLWYKEQFSNKLNTNEIMQLLHACDYLQINISIKLLHTLFQKINTDTTCRSWLRQYGNMLETHPYIEQRIRHYLLKHNVTIAIHHGLRNAIAYNPEKKLLAFSNKNNEIEIWSLYHLRHIKTLTGSSEKISALTFDKHGIEIIAGTMGGHLHIWNVKANTLEQTIGAHTAKINSIDYSYKDRFATGSSDNTVKLWSATNGGLIRTFRKHKSSQFKNHECSVYHVQFSPDGSLLAASTKNKKVIVWNTNTNRRVVSHTQHKRKVYSLAFSSENNVVSASKDRSLVFCSVKNQKPMHYATVHGHKHRVYDVTTSPSGTQFATTGNDQTIKLWDDAGKELFSIPIFSTITQMYYISPEIIIGTTKSGKIKVIPALSMKEKKKCTTKELLMMHTKESQKMLIQSSFDKGW